MEEPEDPFLVAVGRVVRDHRTRAGLTQETLSLKSGRDRTYLSPIEHGLRNVGVSTLRDYAQALGLDLSELIRQAEALERAGPVPGGALTRRARPHAAGAVSGSAPRRARRSSS